eukprot:7120581-Pyramimonas_sp.AAC.1
MIDPVCPLLLALYGHPHAGGFWEQHCEVHVMSKGFVPITCWRSCYYRPELVYVDDFKLAVLLETSRQDGILSWAHLRLRQKIST